MLSAAELAAGAAAAAAFDALRAPWSEASGAVRVTLAEQLRAFHALAPAGPVPTAFSPDSVYPYASFVETAARPELRRVRVVTISNGVVSADVSPDLGGKVLALRLEAASGPAATAAAAAADTSDNASAGAANVLADPGAVRPCRILPRGAFVGGGIEVSFPISHTPSLLERVCCSAGVRGGRARVCVGERELRCGMHWTVEFSLGPGEAFLTQRVRFANTTVRAHKWMSWANAGVPSAPDTQFCFPGGPVLVHGERMGEVADWSAPDAARPRAQRDISTMTAFFWRAPPVCAFGVFTPSTGLGLFHSADPAQVGGMKLWSDGCGEDERWVSQYMTRAGQQLLEVQAGPLKDQSVKDVLAPGAEQTHAEFWWPAVGAPLDLAALAASTATRAAARALGPVEEHLPLFPWARRAAVDVFLAAEAAFAARDAAALPPAPPQESNAWAPPGADVLGAALAWAAGLTDREDRGRWAFQLGAWIAGRLTAESVEAAAAAEEIGPSVDAAATAAAGSHAPPAPSALEGVAAALAALDASDDGRAAALAGRLHRRARGDHAAAAACFRRISEPALQLHPQVVVERDLALAGLGGAAALAERRAWFERVGALAGADEWLRERAAALLLDEGRAREARELLEGPPAFQLVHQRYARTRLWRRAVAACGGDPGALRPPPGLGEDRLAAFGAYVEHEATDVE
jgi:hypothetical protein